MWALRPSGASSGLPANIGTQSGPRVAHQSGTTATPSAGLRARAADGIVEDQRG